MSSNKSALMKILKEPSLKTVEARGLDTLMASILLSIKMHSIEKTASQKNSRILILSTEGFIGSGNNKLEQIMDDLQSRMEIMIADKYTLKAKRITETREDTIVPSEYWRKLSKTLERVDVIIVDKSTTFMIDETTQNISADFMFSVGTQLLETYAKRRGKSIIIVEEEDTPIERLEGKILQENKLKMYLEDDDLFLRSETVEGKPKLKIDPKSLSDATRDDKSKIEKIIRKKNRLTLKGIEGANIRSLPVCKTGFEKLDEILHGGLELGQVVSMTSQNTELLTQMALQMVLQMPQYYTPMIINLTMNSRRLKDILETKAKIVQDERAKDPNEKVRVLPLETLEKNGDIDEIIEAMEYFYKDEDVRIFILDNDNLIQDNSRNYQDHKAEKDAVYRKLQILSSKLDILIIVLTQGEEIEKGIVQIDGSNKAIECVKTQIVLSVEKGIIVTKQLLPAKKMMEAQALLGTSQEVRLLT